MVSYIKYVIGGIFNNSLKYACGTMCVTFESDKNSCVVVRFEMVC